ncbi:MAG TPA: hypothetical protein VFR14_08550 [Candidatus Limnocylindrales bacterium]|nr:hypothetical protein [Candidatus Limnocylindrales bacterium]
MSRLVSLYPRRWRARYGDELLGLLAERPPSGLDRLDLIRGAVDARLHPGLAGPGELAPIDARAARHRRAGIVTLVGAGLWLGGMVVAINGPVVYDSWGTYREGGAALPLIIAATALLAFGLAGTAERLPSGVWLGRVGALASGAGFLLWSVAPWVMATGAVGVLGFTVLGVSAIRSGQWPAWALGLSLASVLAVPLALSGILPVSSTFGIDGQFVVFGSFVVIWLVVARPLLSPSAAPQLAAS